MIADFVPRHLYHAVPLHYLPHILKDSALYAQSILSARAIKPRATANRRDRMLGLADYVHLSPDAHTPLLADKVLKGYPHALLIFDGPAVLATPRVSLLPFNTKAWRSKAAYELVMGDIEQEHLLRGHGNGKRFASLEVLVKYGLALDALLSIAFLIDDERVAVHDLVSILEIPLPCPLVTEPDCFPFAAKYQPGTSLEIFTYFALCQQAGSLLPPPDLPFD